MTASIRVIGFAAIAMIGSAGVFGCGHEHHHDEYRDRGYPQEVVEVGGYRHEGYHDEHGGWHGGYYDEGHQFHQDRGDWRPEERR